MNDFLNLAFEGFGVQVNKCLVQLVKLLKTALQIGQPCSGFEKVRGQCFGAGARRTLMASSCRAISCSSPATRSDNHETVSVSPLAFALI